MRAVRMHRTGGPEVLRLDDVPAPPPPRGAQVLVEVAGSSVNGTDLGLRRGGLGPLLWGRLPFTLGFDLAGTVVACGPAVTAFVPGDRVMALLDHGGGAQAEQVLVDQSRAAVAPSSVPLVEAGALPLAGLTALQALHAKAHLHRRPNGARVLVVGATGGIGTYAVQLAALAGAHVTGLARRAVLADARALGADEVLAREDGPVTGSGERWDVVVDTAGALPGRSAAQVLRPGGVVVSVRPASPDVVLSAARQLLRGGAGRRGSRPDDAPRATAVMTRASSQDLARLTRLVDAGDLRLPVAAVLAAEDCVEAHRHAESGAVGKVVVAMGAGAG